VPQPTDRIKDSQNPFLLNFAGIKTLVDVNHVTFDLADQGKHKHVSFPEQAASPATAANEVALFSQESAYTSVAELAIRKESSGDVVEFTSSTKDFVGWSILPSGILIKWGRSSPITGLTTITWPVAATVPVFSAVYNVTISPLEATAGDVDTAVRLVSFSTTNIVAYVSKRTTTGVSTDNTTLYFVAIGIPV
jgi:hypothetical protein